MPLAKRPRWLLEQALVDNLKSGLFGDGLEDEYLRTGFPPHDPIEKLTDAELVEQCEESGLLDDELLRVLTKNVEVGDYIETPVGWHEVVTAKTVDKPVPETTIECAVDDYHSVVVRGAPGNVARVLRCDWELL